MRVKKIYVVLKPTANEWPVDIVIGDSIFDIVRSMNTKNEFYRLLNNTISLRRVAGMFSTHKEAKKLSHKLCKRVISQERKNRKHLKFEQ